MANLQSHMQHKHKELYEELLKLALATAKKVTSDQ